MNLVIDILANCPPIYWPGSDHAHVIVQIRKGMKVCDLQGMLNAKILTGQIEGSGTIAEKLRASDAKVVDAALQAIHDIYARYRNERIFTDMSDYDDCYGFFGFSEAKV